MTDSKNVATYARIRPHNASINESKKCASRAEKNTIINRIDKKEDQYEFDKVFDMKHDTPQVFDEALKPLLDYKVLEGVNSIFMVYGQTGSGKSFTLIGEETHLGVLPLAIQYLLSRTDKVQKIDLSAIEAYGIDQKKIGFYDLVQRRNEKIKKEKKQSKRKKGAKYDQYKSNDIPGLTSEKAKKIQMSADNCYKVITELQAVSHMAPTLKNLHSSRGHTVYFCRITMHDIDDVYFIAVDLAGSEGVSALGTKDEYMKGMKLAVERMGKGKDKKKITKHIDTLYDTLFGEASCINNGLTQLTKIFEELIRKKLEKSQGLGLRKLLSSFISVNAAYSIMFTLSASKSNSKQSKATLNFAKRTQLVKVETKKAKKKVDKDKIIRTLTATIDQLNTDLEALQKQYERLQEKCNTYESKMNNAPASAPPRALSRMLSLKLVDESKELTQEYDDQMAEEAKWKMVEDSYLKLDELSENELRTAFERFDTDQSGAIDKDELQKALQKMGEDKTMEEVELLIAHVDQDDDGLVDFDEFKIMVAESWFIDAFRSKMINRIQQMMHNMQWLTLDEHEDDDDETDDDEEDEQSDAEMKEYDPQQDVEIQRINQAIEALSTQLDESDVPKDVPLHRFTVKDICNTLKQWVYHDIRYKSNLQKTQQIFNRRKLNGAKIKHLAPEDVKHIVKDELLQFMSAQTLDIMFDYLRRWKEYNEEDIWPKPAQDIAYTLYNYPLLRLVHRMRNESMDGGHMIEILDTQRHNMIGAETGWEKEEVEQIGLLFMRLNTFTRQQFMDNMRKVVSVKNATQNILSNTGSEDIDCIPKTILEAIEKRMSASDIDIEKIHFYIKNNKSNEEMTAFSDAIMDLVNGFDASQFIQQVYTFIAHCFVWDDEENLLMGKAMDWTCNNCGNYNLSQYIDGTMNEDLSICMLCGISQIDSIVLKIRNHDSFVMVNNVDIYDDKDGIERDDIDELISDTVKSQKVDLMCPNRNDDEPCPCILRLSKQLIVYKRWLTALSNRNNHSHSIHKTVQVDIGGFIDNDTFRNTLMSVAHSLKRRIKEPQMQSLTKMFDDNVQNMAGIKEFVGMTRKQFMSIAREITQLNFGVTGKLYSETKKILKKKTQKLQFGQFLSDLDLNQVDTDYHHILRSHIVHGTKDSIKNVFRFFNSIVHYEDTEDTKCVSLKREQKRMIDKNTPEQKQREEERTMDDKTALKERRKSRRVIKDKDIWSLKQHYHQSQLDMIHSYLVHSNWKRMVQQYANKQNKQKKEDDEEATDDNNEKKTPESIVNKDKYVSDQSDFGFGVVHEYHLLKPIFNSLYDETVDNTQCQLEETTFHSALIKAIKMHKIALSNDDYRRVLICRTFNPKYQIIRNEFIGIRHILSIVIYTDISSFCTAFRKTYRKIGNETTEEEVRKRHRELYYFSRFLFESIEFFGKEMDRKLKVYHGLSTVMRFQKFTAFFNQPLSTTTTFQTANQFSQGRGVILQLKSGAKVEQMRRAKYLSVSWLSCFPNEDEKLFYGSHVVLQIANIWEANQLVDHSRELKMFNEFQKTIHNGTVRWDKLPDEMVKALQILIENQQKNVLRPPTSASNPFITKYGIALFEFFCKHPNTTKICICNFEALPKPLYNALFMDEQKLSLIPMLRLFPNLKEMILNKLDMEHMTKHCKQYRHVVLNLVKSKSCASFKKISFKSKKQNDGKQNSTLRRLQKNNRATFRKYQWSVEYEYEIEASHTLVFNNNEIEIKDKIQQLMNRERQLQLQQEKDQNELFELQRQQVDMEQERVVAQKKQMELREAERRKQIELQAEKQKQMEENEKLQQEMKVFAVEHEKREQILKDKEITLNQRLEVNVFLSELNACFGILQDHYDLINAREDAINAMISNAKQSKLKKIKEQAVEQQKDLLSQVMSMYGMHHLLEAMLTMEHAFAKEFTDSYQIDQRKAREEYGPSHMDEYERAPKPMSHAASFEDLMSKRRGYLDSFSDWLDRVKAQCKRDNIGTVAFNRPESKQLARTFYDAFYIDHASGSIRHMTDFIRCCIVFNDFDNLYRCFTVIDELSKECGGILRCDDGFQEQIGAAIYRNVVIEVYCPGHGDELVCQIQLDHTLFHSRKAETRQIARKAKLFEVQNGVNTAYQYAKKRIQPHLDKQRRRRAKSRHNSFFVYTGR
eukprot:184085_1